ncbi:MAG: diguanylate cyclase (GGDEF)-like protein [Candidatus Azotimanducaceae bacterium]|jgi:diguanylate cyclase (GGDEF)-like protein
MSEVLQLKKEVAKLNAKVSAYEAGMRELRIMSDIQDSLNEILNISLLPSSLQEQMGKVLHLILDIPWLELDGKGCVFLTDEKGTGLKMVAHQNLDFKNCLDQELSLEGISPLGRYNIPIISANRNLGLLNLYSEHGHEQTDIERNFLSAISKAMAGIIERKLIEEKLHKLSYQDDLTGIANRRLFMSNLDEMIIKSKENEHKFAILFIDLDHFKSINDTYGHEYGDAILIQATIRMEEALRDTDVIARLGGDEFVAMLEMISSPSNALKIANTLIEELSKPYLIKSNSLLIGASIGISIYPTHAHCSEGLLKKADIALYEAKEDRGKAILLIEE